MTIEAEVTAEDYQAFVRHVAAATFTPSPQKMVGSLISIGIGLFFGFCITLTSLSRNLSTLGATLCGALLGAALMVVVVAAISRMQLRCMIPSADGIILGKNKVTLCEEGIRQQTRHHQALYNWSTIQAVNTTAQYVFVMVDRVGGLILPVKAFTSDGEREHFIAEIHRRSAGLSK